jgi:hypothetical protein
VIFISYKSEESAQAHAVRSLLEANGIDCWMAPDSIEPGGEYGTQITNAVRTCDALVLLLTEAAQASTYVLSEIDLAMTFKKDIVPLHLDDVELNDAFLFRIGVMQRIEAPGHAEEACRDLVMRLRKVGLARGEGQVAPEELLVPVVVPDGVVRTLEQVQEARVAANEAPRRLSFSSARFHLIICGVLTAAFVVIAQFDPNAEWLITSVVLFALLFEVIAAVVLGLSNFISRRRRGGRA